MIAEANGSAAAELLQVSHDRLAEKRRVTDAEIEELEIQAKAAGINIGSPGVPAADIIELGQTFELTGGVSVTCTSIAPDGCHLFTIEKDGKAVDVSPGVKVSDVAERCRWLPSVCEAVGSDDCRDDLGELLNRFAGQWKAGKTQEMGSVHDQPRTQSEPFFRLLSAAELANGDFKLEYLIPGLLASLQPLIIAGQFKTLKTSIALEIALSLASATKFLGRFEIPNRKRVLVLTAESGMATVQETCFRMCKTHSIDLASLDGYFTVTDRVPQLASASHTQELHDIIEKGGFDVVIADPAYLMIDGSDAGNLFSMGDQLRIFSELALSANCTPVLVHHAKKNNLNSVDFQPLELGDIAWAGFAEFARQWLLLSRRERYEEGTGKHRLWMSVGGSAGHNGCWGIDITEGHPNDDGGRKWDVEVNNAKESDELAQQRKEQAKDTKRDLALSRSSRKLQDAFVGVGRNGLTKTDAFAKAGLNQKNGVEALGKLLTDEILEDCEVRKTNNHTYSGYRLSTKALEQAKEDEQFEEQFSNQSETTPTLRHDSDTTPT